MILNAELMDVELKGLEEFWCRNDIPLPSSKN
jgi:hypothetical protein